MWIAKKYLLVAYLGIGLLLLTGTVIKDRSPTFFPLDNKEGIYVISKKCPQAQGWDTRQGVTGNAYCVEYTGSDVFNPYPHKPRNFFRITVGYSRVDLEPLVGKPIHIKRGRFVTSDQQCIQRQCQYIYGPYVVLNLLEIEEKN